MDGSSPGPRRRSSWPSVFPHNPELERLEAELFELWGHLNAATFRFLELVAEFDRRQGWARHGVASCAQWLSWQCGVGSVAAREKVRVARALERLPKISDSFRRGAISYSKVRAMTRIAHADNEDALLNVAEHGTAAHVEKLVRKYCWVERIEDARRADRQHYVRYLRFSYDEDGSMLLRAKLPPQIGAVVRKAVEAAVALAESDKRETESNVSAEAPGFMGTNTATESREVEPFTVNSEWGAKRADGLLRVAESFLSRQKDETGSLPDRYQVVVHVDQRVLAAGKYQGPGRCELDDGRALALATVQRLSCDCSLVGIAEDDDGEPLNVGRKTRAISPALQRALKSRDGGCGFPGCDRTRFTEAHHVKHWAHGGETKLSNLITLCSFHHTLIHEGGFGLQATDDGVFVFTRPDGTRIGENGAFWRFRGNNPSEKSVDALFERNLSRGVDIDDATARCRWLGERMDYGLAIEHLILLRDRRRRDYSALSVSMGSIAAARRAGR